MLISQGNWSFLVQRDKSDELGFYIEIGGDFSCSIKTGTIDFQSLPTEVTEYLALFMHEKIIKRRREISNFQIEI